MPAKTHPISLPSPPQRLLLSEISKPSLAKPSMNQTKLVLLLFFPKCRVNPTLTCEFAVPFRFHVHSFLNCFAGTGTKLPHPSNTLHSSFHPLFFFQTDYEIREYGKLSPAVFTSGCPSHLEIVGESVLPFCPLFWVQVETSFPFSCPQ